LLVSLKHGLLLDEVVLPIFFVKRLLIAFSFFLLFSIKSFLSFLRQKKNSKPVIDLLLGSAACEVGGYSVVGGLPHGCVTQ